MVFLCCIYQFSLLTGQDTTTIYLNRKYEVAKNQNSAKYYRKLFRNNELWCANDYYLNGILKMTGSYIDNKCTRKQGVFTNYYESGIIKSIEQYIDNKKNGKWIEYYENGQKDTESEFVNNSKSGWWTWYSIDGVICAKEKYKEDKRIKATFYNKEGKKVEISEAEFAPIFEGGGIEKFTSWVAERVDYPKYLANSQIKGDVRIQFTVNPFGELVDFKILNSVYSTIDEVVLNIIKSSPKWVPGKLHNREFAYQYEISIHMEYKKK